MKAAKILVGTLAALLVLSAPAQAQFGLKNVEGGFFNENGEAETRAGSHPFAAVTSFEVTTRMDPLLGEVPEEAAKTVRFAQPAGFIGSRTAVPTCTTADFLAIDINGRTKCADATAIGFTRLQVVDANEGFNEPVYNLVPPPGVAAKFGFIAFNTPVTVDIGLNDRQPFNLLASAVNIAQSVDFFAAELQLWGVPADHAHDTLRGRCLDLTAGPNGEARSLGTCNTGAPEVPFLTLPRSCTGPLVTSYEAVSWQHPDAPPLTGSFTSSPGMTGCSKLGFAPRITAKPTAASAESASGLDVDIFFNQEGLANPKGLAQSDIKKSVVTLPAGMTVNPSSANGLAVCSKAGFDAESLASGPGEGCPQASKVGEVEVETPLLAAGETLRGSVFLASQDDNPFGTLIALYMVIKNRDLGILIKQSLKVEPNEEAGPNAGRLVTTLDDFPQTPFSHANFHFTEGARGALITPPTCGNYTIESLFSPWANPAEPLLTTAGFNISAGVGGGPCPVGAPPFHPGFSAGSLNNAAGAYSPFDMRLTRTDGDQGMTRFDAVLPKGVIGKLAGVARCPDSAIAVAKAKTGRQELANPSCPANSQIGHSLAGAGVGSVLTYAPGKLYLGGPLAGAPLSVIAITPAVAGPFDVGTVVLHEALAVDPETAEVKVDGSRSDPIPTALKGIVLRVKDVRVDVDRPNFTLNPTSCAEKQTKATIFGSFLNVFSPADDVPVALKDRYQAASCASLKFKPSLSLQLKGGSKRGAHPALKALVRYPKGASYANTRKAVVTFPHSAFLEQAHIRTVCTRVQFAAKQCPAGSIYGKAKAFSPLLDEPLQGPIYLRSSSNPLPDLVLALHGLVDVDAVARIDSVNASIRTTFPTVPDAPLTKVVVEMQGGKKGLIVNSRNLCASPSRATSEFTGQNGRISDTRPVMKADCGGKKGKKKR